MKQCQCKHSMLPPTRMHSWGSCLHSFSSSASNTHGKDTIFWVSNMPERALAMMQMTNLRCHHQLCRWLYSVADWYFNYWVVVAFVEAMTHQTRTWVPRTPVPVWYHLVTWRALGRGDSTTIKIATTMLIQASHEEMGMMLLENQIFTYCTSLSTLLSK